MLLLRGRQRRLKMGAKGTRKLHSIKGIKRYIRNSTYSVVAEGDVQKVGEALEKVREQAGKLTAKVVVDAARPSTSILHKYFEWNDRKAAERYRLSHQANDLIHSVRVQVVIEGKKEEVAAFMNVTASGRSEGEGWETMNEVTLKSENVLQRAVEELRNWRLRWRGVTKLRGVFRVVDRTVTEVLNGKNVKKEKAAA